MCIQTLSPGFCPTSPNQSFKLIISLFPLKISLWSTTFTSKYKMFSSQCTMIVINIQPWQNTYLLHILEGEENQLKFLLTKMKENEGMEKLTLQFSDISENTISQSLKIFQCKTFQAHGKVIVQIYRPCINIKVFTSFSKDFSQTACWLNYSCHYFPVFMLPLYILHSEDCSAYQHPCKLQEVISKLLVSPQPFLPKESDAGHVSTSSPLSQLHAYSTSLPHVSLQLLTLRVQHQLQLSSWTFQEREWLRVGKVYFRLEEGLYLLVFTVAWEEFCGGLFGWFVWFFFRLHSKNKQ